uniref:RNase H type-1 domain-containing protein n=1 Tax=Brassica oleracea var. oleracea TaxID=109376 RepID=A0A0D3DRT8_BRAOL
MVVLIWAMKCMKNLRQFKVTFATDCFSIEVSSEIDHVPRTENLRADSLACSARKQPSFVVHMDAVLPIWFLEST